MDFDEALARVDGLLERGGRVLLGTAGAPGAGKTPAAAEAWVDAVDLPNAALIAPTRRRAAAILQTA